MAMNNVMRVLQLTGAVAQQKVGSYRLCTVASRNLSCSTNYKQSTFMFLRGTLMQCHLV